MMDADESRNWRLFDLAYANLQSISKAQQLYLTTLLAFLCVVWGWAFVGTREAVSIQLLGMTLRASGFWIIAPLVCTLLTLSLIGSINAAGPAWARLKDAFSKLNLELPTCDLVFYNLDTHKNLFDYFTFLVFHPEDKPREERGGRYDPRHFLYSSLFAISLYTTYRAMHEPVIHGEIVNLLPYQMYVGTCFAVQLAFSVRPFYRAFCRFFGVRQATVYD